MLIHFGSNIHKFQYSANAVTYVVLYFYSMTAEICLKLYDFQVMINIPIFKLEFQIYWLITLKPISVKMLKIMIIPVSKQSHQIHKMSREIKTIQIKFFKNKAQTINLRRFILY